MHKNERKAIINGKEVTVYKSRERGTWIDSSDLNTEYDPKNVKLI